MFSLISARDAIITLAPYHTAFPNMETVTLPMARDLSELRREIDDLDDQIHALLRQRTLIVEEVRAYKKEERVKIRPAREAEIIYRLFAQHSGAFPKPELFRMWRELIVATLRMEGPFSVGVFMDESNCGFWDLARDQYGSFVPMSAYPSARRIIEAVQKQEVILGILPLPERAEKDPWWRRLVFEGADAPRVIARLPFVPGSNARSADHEALVICPVAQQPTGRDRSYLAMESTRQLSADALSKVFADVDINVIFFTDCHDANHPQIWQSLIEVDGFVAANEPRIKAVEDTQNGAILRVVGLGGYAVPVSAAELE